MPIPFQRFRLLNESKKPVKKASFQGHTDPHGYSPPELPPQDVVPGDLGELPPFSFRDVHPHKEDGTPFEDLRNVTVIDIEMQGKGIGLVMWPLFLEGVEACIADVEVTVADVPVEQTKDQGDEWYLARAQVLYEDEDTGQQWYHSFTSPHFQ